MTSEQPAGVDEFIATLPARDRKRLAGGLRRNHDTIVRESVDRHNGRVPGVANGSIETSSWIAARG
jgi:hypothetical protein